MVNRVFDRRESGVSGKGGAQVGGHKPGLPIVAMKDIGAEKVAGHGQGRARENGEADVVIGIIHAGFAIEALAVVERRAIHQVERVLGGGHVDGDIEARRAEVHGETIPDVSEISTAGKNGQFRTPRHIIKLISELVDPQLGHQICDPACGTAGFLLDAYQYIVTQLARQKAAKGQIFPPD